MADASGGKRWLKYGCLGCAGVLVLIVIVAASAAGIGWFRASSMKAEEEVITQDLAASARPVESPGVAPDALAADLPGSADRIAGPVPGKISLRMRHAEFQVEPAGLGEPLRVEASYDRDSYELIERLDTDAGGRWTYDLTFRRRGGSYLITALAELFSGTSPEVHVFLPRDVPYDLELELMEGGAVTELGGLWLLNADVRMERGGFEMRVSDPLRESLGRMTLRTSMGGGAIKSLGNASPRKLDVVHRMGGLSLDLRGKWVEDSDISIELQMGGGAVLLPKDVVLEGVPGRGGGRAAGRDLPRLKIQSSCRMGELEFVD